MLITNCACNSRVSIPLLVECESTDHDTATTPTARVIGSDITPTVPVAQDQEGDIIIYIGNHYLYKSCNWGEPA